MTPDYTKERDAAAEAYATGNYRADFPDTYDVKAFTAGWNSAIQSSPVKELVAALSCGCGDVGYWIRTSYDGEPEQEQCEFCYTEPKSRFRALANYKSEIKKIAGG